MNSNPSNTAVQRHHDDDAEAVAAIHDEATFRREVLDQLTRLQDALEPFLASLPQDTLLPLRITLDKQRLIAVVEGRELPLTETQFSVVKVLYKHAPAWVCPQTFKNENVIVGKVPELIDRLPDALRRRIEKESGIGCRLMIRW